MLRCENCEYETFPKELRKMAKNKRKANLAKSTADKKKKSDRLNPFEIRFNREKHTVLNRKPKSTVIFKK